MADFQRDLVMFFFDLFSITQSDHTAVQFGWSLPIDENNNSIRTAHDIATDDDGDSGWNDDGYHPPLGAQQTRSEV